MRRLLSCILVVGLLPLLACEPEVDGPEPRMEPPAGDMATNPSFLCNEGHDAEEGTWVTVDGEAFSPLVVDSIASEDDPDVELPIVSLILQRTPTGESVDEASRFKLDSPLGSEDGDVRWVDETTMLFRVTDELELPEGVYDIEVENPNGHVATETEAFGVVPRPVIDAVVPDSICVEQGERSVTLEGDNFLIGPEEGPHPTVSVGDQSYDVDSTDGCAELHDVYVDYQLCTEAEFTVDESSIDPGNYDVTYENPAPGDCNSADDSTIYVAPPPEITSVDPRVACNTDGTVTFDVEGENFLEIDGEMTHIVVDDEQYDATGVDCQDVEGTENTRECDALSVDIDLEAAELEGPYPMVAVNPEPADCTSAESEEFYSAGPPNITDAEPDGICGTDTFDGELELFGQFLYDPEGDEPTVEVEGQSVDFDLLGCEAALDDYDNLELCGGIDLDIPASLVDDLEDEEEFDVTVTGADPVACGSETFTMHRTEPPTVASVSPRRVCSDGSSFEVTGENLHPDAEAYLDGVAADDVDVAADGESADVTFGSGLSTGTATFEFVNPGDCGYEYEEDIRVTDGPLPIFVDPPVVFNQMNTQVTIYAAGLYDEVGGTIDEVELIHPDGSTTDLDFSTGSRPNVVNADIPADLLDDVDDDDYIDDEDAAMFGVRLTDEEITCSNEADDLLKITDETTLALEEIYPPFGGQAEDTDVEITASDDPGDDEAQFEATPRAYLNPTDDSDGLGQEIRAIQFVDETELNGIVPSGLSVGTYDLIVVNPEGEVGVLDEAYEVTEELPPRVESVSPSAWPTSTISVDVEGQHFRDDPDNPDVDVFCQPTGEDIDDEDDLDQPNSITVDTVSPTLIELTVDASNLDPLSACYMRVTNPDGTYDEYSPITITNPAAKFLEFQDGPDLNDARRAPTTLSGSPTRANHYVYAIGGDDGDTDDQITTGEVSRIDRFGAPTGWSYLPYELPEGRSFSDGVRIDDFVYMVGGVKDDGVTGEILRSRVLDPTDVPEIVAVDIDVEELLDDPTDPGGMDEGTYYYRVSAVYSDDDPANPEGESLASEPQPVQLPLDGAEVTIEWEPPEQINHDIEEYRVYRNVEPDDPYGNESLIGTVDDGSTTFTDDGSVTPDDAEQPLPLGSLGTWKQVGELDTERRSAGITFAPSPAFDDEYFIYAIGGEDDDGEMLDDYEFVSVNVFGERDQDVGTPMQGVDGEGDALLLPEARTAHSASVAYGRNASSVAGQAPSIFVYAGEADSNDAHVRVTYVGDDGYLNEWEELGASLMIPGGQTSGHVGAVMNNNLVYAGGGSSGDAGDGGDHTEVQCDGDDCPPATISTNFSNLSDLQMEPRAWMGAIPFRGLWYHTGGVDNADDPTPTVQFSVAGATP